MRAIVIQITTLMLASLSLPALPLALTLSAPALITELSKSWSFGSQASSQPHSFCPQNH